MPGDPSGIQWRSPLTAIAGFGVSLGLLPGAITDGRAGFVHDWAPLEDGANPKPGMMGAFAIASVGVEAKRAAEKI